MKFIKLFFLVAILSTNIIFAQENEEEIVSLDSGTIENQFDYLIDKSNRYQDYKVVKKNWIYKLKGSVNDSLNILKSGLAQTKQTLIQKEKQISELTNTLEATNENVIQLNKEKSSINFFGALISKPLYNTILWSIIGVLLCALLLFIYKFKQSNVITKETKLKFSELDTEFEGYKHRSLEREQQLRRKLQDEINKQTKKG